MQGRIFMNKYVCLMLLCVLRHVLFTKPVHQMSNSTRRPLIHRVTVGFSFFPGDGRRDSFMRRLTKPQRLSPPPPPTSLLMYSRGYSIADCPLLNHGLFQGWTEFTNREKVAHSVRNLL